MKKVKMLLCFLLAVAMIATMFVGCGKQKPAEDKGEATKQAEATEAAEPAEKERYTMVLDLWDKMDSQEVVKAMEEVTSVERFSHIDFEFLDKSPDYQDKMPISVASGQQRDIVGVFNPIQMETWAKAGTIQPLDQYMDELGVDFDERYGSFAAPSRAQSGDIVQIPEGPTVWAMYYNKKIFDDAGIEYPSATEPMTWDEYKELAKQLTSGEGDDKIYGALQLLWPMYWYGEAIQKLGGAEHFYNAEGLSNIEDPAFEQALQREYDMMHVDQSIPTYADIKVSKINAPAWLNGKYGMYVHGQWMMNWLVDKETYPRDFEVGIAPMPVYEGQENRMTWGVVGGYGIAATSINPVEATDVAMELTKIEAKYSNVTVPTYQGIEPASLYNDLAEVLSAEGMTKEVIVDAFANSDIEFVTEKIVGPACAEYDTIVQEEVEKFLVQDQDMETTMQNIKERANKAIEKAKE